MYSIILKLKREDMTYNQIRLNSRMYGLLFIFSFITDKYNIHVSS